MFETKALKNCSLAEIQGMNNEGFTPTKLVKYICHTFQYNFFANSDPDNQLFAGKSHFILSYVYWTDSIGKDIAGYETEKQCEQRFDKLAKYLARYNLGTLYDLPPGRNPNYKKERTIHMCVLVPNHKGFLKLSRDRGWARKRGACGHMLYFIDDDD